MKEPKSELAVLFDKWLREEEVNLATVSTLTTVKVGELLQAAFLAGAKANEQVREELCDGLGKPTIALTPPPGAWVCLMCGSTSPGKHGRLPNGDYCPLRGPRFVG